MPHAQPTSTGNSTKLLDVQAVADLLDCSPRHIYRLTDTGRMPGPVKFGTLARWPQRAIEEWIGNGCPSCDEGSL
jgi:excisionase family DNA binding protein